MKLVGVVGFGEVGGVDGVRHLTLAWRRGGVAVWRGGEVVRRRGGFLFIRQCSVQTRSYFETSEDQNRQILIHQCIGY